LCCCPDLSSSTCNCYFLLTSIADYLTMRFSLLIAGKFLFLLRREIFEVADCTYYTFCCETDSASSKGTDLHRVDLNGTVSLLMISILILYILSSSIYPNYFYSTFVLLVVRLCSGDTTAVWRSSTKSVSGR
jgi:hypothetical protein